MTDIISSKRDDSPESPKGDDSSGLDMTIVSSTPLASASGLSSSNFADLAKLLEGQQLDHFQLLETIGGGGMGVVFRAIDTQLGRTVAVKVLSRYEAGDEDALVRFKNEAQSAARLDHVNIARVYYVGEDKGWHYIVFEYIDGINVRDLVERDGPLSIADAVNFTLQTAEAIGHASRRDVVHRDIKPSNVLITEESRAKVVDMGLARMHQIEHSSEDLTASGVTLGTFDYISPEQARDPRIADVRSDVYSLGCTLFFMLAGRPPFPEGTVLQKLLMHQSEPPPRLRQLRPDAPAELLAIADKMLAKNPKDRYQDAATLVAELYSLAEKLGIRTGSASALAIVPRSAAEPSRFSKHLPWLLPVATLACAVVLLEVFRSPHAASSAPPPVSGTIRVARPTPEEGSSPTQPKPLIPKPDETSDQPQEVLPNGENNDKSHRTEPREGNRAPDVPSPVKTGSQSDEGPSPDVGSPDDTPTSNNGSSKDNGDKTSGKTSPRPSDEPAKSDNKKSNGATAGQRLLIVAEGDIGEDDTQFTTLRAACQAAKNGDVIELRYDGPHIERPIHFKQHPLTIRAGSRSNGKRYRPQIVFRPRESDLNEYSNGMLVIETGASLRVIGVHLIFDPGEVAAQQWSFISLTGAKSFKLSSSWLTIRNAATNNNAYHRDVAFFHVRPGAKQEVKMITDTSMTNKRMPIELTDCVVRGEARVLQIDAMTPVSFQWINGLCATTQSLVYAQGGKKELPESHTASRIDLQHITAMLGEGLYRFAGSKSAPYQRSMELRCSNSILIGNSDTPLVTQSSLGSADNLQAQLSYAGERMFYQRFREFWRIDGRQSDEPSTIEIDFDRWRAHWKHDELYPQLDEVIWERPPAFTKPAHQRVPDEFLLEPSDFNPAIGGGEGGASDGKDAGMLLDSMRDLKEEDIESESDSAREKSAVSKDT